MKYDWGEQERKRHIKMAASPLSSSGESAVDNEV